MRIVSLLSSATEMIYALGLQDRLVAISHECDFPPEALRLPRASRSRFDPTGMTSGEIDAAVRGSMVEHGSVYEVDREAISKLNPDVILTQAVCEVCAVPTGSVLDAVKGLEPEPRVVSLDAHRLEEILQCLRQVATAAGDAESGSRVDRRLRERLQRVRDRVAGRSRPRVLMLEWLDPLFTPGHWVPEMVEIAGGELLSGEAGERSEEISADLLGALDPDVLLIEPCGYDLQETRRDADEHRTLLEELASRAVAAERAWLLHSSFFSRSGPRVVDGIEALAAVLHPERFPEGPDPTIAARW